MSDALELLLRGGAASMYLVLGLVLLRDGKDRTLARLGALFALGTAFWALNTEPFDAWLRTWAFPLVVISFGNTAAFWLFSRALFDDEFRLRALEVAIWGIMAAVGTAWYLSRMLGYDPLDDYIRVPFQVAQIALSASAAWCAWNGRSADLVEPRRRARIAFVLLSSLLMIGVTLPALAPWSTPRYFGDLNVIRMFVVALGMALVMSGLRMGEVFSRSRDGADMALDHGALAVGADPAETRLQIRLQRLMEEERAYRAERLTIGALAARAGVPEYALRRLINRRLGYRNFNAYLNAWRLRDAKAALVDPAQRQVPISTIALDAGFSSLGPFNRAFKAAEGVTPREFRERGGAVEAPGPGRRLLEAV